MKNIPFVNLQRQYQQIAQEIGPVVQKVLTESQFLLGPEVEAFESEFAKFCEATYCIGVASGSDALMLSLKVLGIGRGDEVITVPNSFFATALYISQVGATPVFVDIGPKTYQMDVGQLASKISSRTKAVIPVHMHGHPVDMKPLLEIARQHQLMVIEDACQAHGARYRGQRVGTFGDISAISFHPSKNLGAYGDAGAVITNNQQLAEEVYALRTYGGKIRDRFEKLGYNSRLDAFHAAILRVKLRHLEEWNSLRRAHAKKYTELLRGLPLMLPEVPAESESVFHLYVIRTKQRDGLVEFLKHKNIATGIQYPIPIHRQKAYDFLGLGEGSYPEAEAAAREVLSLPVCPQITDEEIEYVVKSVKDFFKTI